MIGWVAGLVLAVSPGQASAMAAPELACTRAVEESRAAVAHMKARRTELSPKELATVRGGRKACLAAQDVWARVPPANLARSPGLADCGAAVAERELALGLLERISSGASRPDAIGDWDDHLEGAANRARLCDRALGRLRR